jgi:putative FmdB family regulatory protein
MPIYDYKCDNCSNEWEEEKSILDPVTKQCPKCLEQTAKRLISNTSFQLKGSCWAKDSYSSNK